MFRSNFLKFFFFKGTKLKIAENMYSYLRLMILDQFLDFFTFGAALGDFGFQIYKGEYIALIWQQCLQKSFQF